MTLHADRDASMKAKTTALMLADLCVTKSPRAGLGNLNRGDKWIFCLTAARIAAKQERS